MSKIKNNMAEAEARIKEVLESGGTELDLSGFGLNQIPESIGNLTQLQDINLSNNQLFQLPEILCKFNQLKSLDLSNNQLTQLTEAIGKLNQLKSLDLRGNALIQWPQALGNLIQLQYLYLSNNRFIQLPEAIGNLTQLQDLDLMNTQLIQLPESLVNLTQLQYLYLSDNQLTQLPDIFGNLTRLQRLTIANNQLTQLSEVIGKLTQLRELYLSDNELTQLPESIGNLTQLKRLFLYGNEITQLPETIGTLTQLQKLDLSGNQLTQLPESIGNLTQLKYLSLNNNRLIQVPEVIGNLTQLQRLDINTNQLNQLPESIGNLIQLKKFPLYKNKLTHLPESIGDLKQLQSIVLDKNQLTQLPESIGKLTQLKVLCLPDNKLTQLPESIGNLTQLQQLFLRNNELTQLSESIRNLAQLQRLDLHDNDALGLSKEVLGPSLEEIGKPANPSEIIDYYFRLSGGKSPLNQAKLILVGRGAVGKTSLVNRIIKDEFNEGQKKTDGIEITEWGFQLNGDEEIRLNVWDFGGQEIMHATHQFFLTQRSLYLLVLNGREGGEDADAEYWLKLISSFGGDSPVILVMNKIKDHPFDLNRPALEKKYPIREFIKTDCEENIGIEELKKAIERETDRLDHLRDPFPTSWFDIKDQLSGMDDNFLDFAAYCKVCEEHGEKDEQAQSALAGHLHNLGIILNYNEDPRLQDTHVLNPHWVTDGIYKILNSELLDKQKGEICLTDLSSILDKKEYPVNMRCFLFDLMKKFDLCFAYHGSQDRFLIPELLDKQEAKEANEFEPEACLNFQYHYPILPEGLLPRFIVRSHAMSEGLSRWRTGVILVFEGCKALVKADPQDKKVFISVSGPLSNRRRLLAVIRSDFERIHRDIKNLKPEEMVPLPEYPHIVEPHKNLLVMEEKGIKIFQKVVGNDVVELDVQVLLNGVDLEGMRREGRKRDESKLSLRLFCSYSHNDEELRNELETHLKLMERQGVIETWNDRKIMAGDGWKDKIDDNLERADIILLLVSADFIASDYCYDKEMGRALEREKNGEARVIPVIVRDVNWAKAPFANLQALPKDGKAVKLWPDKDTAWRDVSEGIEKMVDEMSLGKGWKELYSSPVGSGL